MFSNDSFGSAEEMLWRWTKCQKGPCTIQLRYLVTGTILARTGAGTGLEKNGQPEPDLDIRYILITIDMKAGKLTYINIFNSVNI